MSGSSSGPVPVEEPVTALPDERGHFGQYGGMYVAETLMPALQQLRDQYLTLRDDPDFVAAHQRG